MRRVCTQNFPTLEIFYDESLNSYILAIFLETETQSGRWLIVEVELSGLWY